MWLLQWIAYASMTGSEHSTSLTSHARWVQFKIHQLVHILQDEHVTIQLNNALILHKRERREFTPTIVETWIAAVILVYRWEQILDFFLRDASDIESLVPFLGKRLGVQRDQWILGLVELERVIKC